MSSNFFHKPFVETICGATEFSFTSGVIEGSGYFDLGNGGHLPAAGGTGKIQLLK